MKGTFSYLNTERIFIEILAPNYFHGFSFSELIYMEKSRYQLIELYDHKVFGKILILDGRPQFSSLDEHIYHEILVHPAMIAHPNPKQIAILGGGDGCALREVLKYSSAEKVFLVDMDERVVEVCREYLPEINQGSFDDPRVKLMFMDAYAFIKDWNGSPFDVIIIDLTDPISLISAKLYTQEFFKLISSKLSENGILSIQCESPTISKWLFPIHFANIAATLKSVFKHVIHAREFIFSYGSDWGFSYASQSIDLESLTSDLIDRRLKERGIKTKYYCGDTHESITKLPLSIKSEIDSEKPIKLKDAMRYVEEYMDLKDKLEAIL